ncbi:MAG: BrnT family toxin [Puniceicoccaceae bacterium]
MYDWSDEKDQILKQKRGIGFEDIVFHLDQGDLIAVSEHPNKEKYPDQRVMYVRVDDYIYLVPFVQSGRKMFLKTIIPSRKATKKYLEETR